RRGQLSSSSGIPSPSVSVPVVYIGGCVTTSVTVGLFASSVAEVSSVGIGVLVGGGVEDGSASNSIGIWVERIVIPSSLSLIRARTVSITSEVIGEQI